MGSVRGNRGRKKRKMKKIKGWMKEKRKQRRRHGRKEISKERQTWKAGGEKMPFLTYRI